MINVTAFSKYHSRCLMLCPLFFRYPSIVKGNNALPPEDRLLKFLVDNNADSEEIVHCANCDQESNKTVLKHFALSISFSDTMSP